MDFILGPLAKATGASLDQIKLITCLLIAYPFGSVFIRIPRNQPVLKHLFNIVVTLFFFFPVLGLYSAFFQLLASVLATYFIALYVRTPRMPWIVFTVVMGHLTVNHIIRAVYNLSYETLEVTGPQMVLTMKLTTFAWNVFDGRRPIEDLDKWQRAKRVDKYPSLLEFLGYAFYFPGILVGPYLEYADYQSLIDESLFKAAEGSGKTKPGLAVPTGRKRVAYYKMAMGLFYLGCYVILGGNYNYPAVLRPEFLYYSWGKRVLLVQLFGVIERSKYYAIWTLTEGASILTGLGFTGFSESGATRWDGAANVKPLGIEIPENFKMILDSWNMKTNVWLRECVYKRVTPKGKKPGFRSSMITFATSAFWHGVSGGYYIAFFFAGFITTAARLARSTFRPLVAPAPNSPPSTAKRAYDVFGGIISVLLLNYAASPFMILTITGSLTCWSRLGWYGHVVVGAGLLFFYAGGQKAMKKLHPEIAPNGTRTPLRSGASTPTQSFAVPPLDEVVPPPKM